MKWVTVQNNNSAEVFELWETDEKLADISFNAHTRFARLVSKLGKRIFSFEKKGLFTPKKILRNEYGVKMGTVKEINPGTGKGTVELNGQKYCFVISEGEKAELQLYDESMNKSLLSCGFDAITGRLIKTRSLLDGKFASLLLVLCWCAFQQHHPTAGSALKDADLILP